MLHASSLTSRMTMFAGQSAPVFDAKSDSTARRVLSHLTLSPLPYAALRATLLNMLSTNPYNNGLDESRQELLSINGGTSSRCGRQSRKRPPDESGDREQSRSSAFWLSSAQLTTTHPIPAMVLRLQEASRRVRASGLPFFEPSRDGVTRDAEGAGETAQTAALVVSAKDLFALLF